MMKNKVMEGDCLKLLPAFESESIDLVLTDPPYSINFKSNMGLIDRFDYIINDHNLDFFAPFVREAWRVLKMNTCIILFCRFDNYPYFYNVVVDQGFTVKNCLVWEKNKALGGLGDMESSFINNYEFVLFAMKGRRILFENRIGRTFGLIKDDSISSPMQLQYPTQKPLHILRRLIQVCSLPGETVLDPFCGSGSTLLAAKQNGRDYVGMDLNPEAIRLSKHRLAQEVLAV